MTKNSVVSSLFISLLIIMMCAGARAQLPDLEPVGVSAAVANGEYVTFSYSIRNKGNVPANPPFECNVGVSSNGVDVGSWVVWNSMESVGPGLTVTMTNKCFFPTWAGTGAFFVVVADDTRVLGHSVIESDEANNTKVFPLTMHAPDLEPVGVSAAVANGDHVTFSYSIRNNGDVPAAPSFVCNVGVSSNGVDVGSWVAYTEVDSLAPGQTVTVTNTCFFPTWAGTGGFLVVVADDYSVLHHSLYESDEANNTKVFPLTMHAPDLEPVGVSAAVANGDHVTFSYSIRNNGDVPAAPSFVCNVGVSSNGVDVGSWVAYTEVDSLAPGQTVTVTNTSIFPTWAGTGGFLVVVADDYSVLHHSLYESDEENNTKIYPLALWRSDIDTDGDGFDDAWEVQHGWNPTVPDRDVLPYILSQSAVFGVYVTNLLGSLAPGSLLIGVVTNTVHLSIQLETSPALVPTSWTNAGSPVEWSMPVATNKAFYRVGIKE